MAILIASHNPNYSKLSDNLSNILNEEVKIITQKEELNISLLENLSPRYVFFPHWSFFIPEKIFNSYNCIVFHMTDLPFGRGGSPLQNLIVRGIEQTKISALKVVKELDAGPVYLKEELSLNGTAKDIFERCLPIVQKMIVRIISENIIPEPQTGEPTIFNRRKPEESNISELKELSKVFDYIRMLDADGYPNAYLETEYFKFEFTGALLNKNNSITSNVRITKK